MLKYWNWLNNIEIDFEINHKNGLIHILTHMLKITK